MNRSNIKSSNKTKKYGILVLIMLMTSSFAFASAFANPPSKPVQKTIGPDEALRLIKANRKKSSLVILDVRTPAEYTEGHLANAINIDFNAGDFAQNISKLDKTKKYLVYCRTGHRSANATEVMKNQSFETIYNLDGGITKWISEKNPVVK